MSVVAFISAVFCIHLFGRWALKLFRVEFDDDPLRAFLISCALGMMVLSGLAFLFLAVGLGYKIVFAIIIYVGGIWGVISTRRQFWAAVIEFRDVAFEKGKRQRHLFAGLVLFFLLLTFYITLAPTTAWDGLTYHYPLPDMWLHAHSFHNIPDIVYSNFPSSAELVFIYGFAAHSDITANHLTWFAGLLCVLYLFNLGRRHFTPEAGLGAGIILLSYPVIYIEELQGGYIDLFQAFYILALLDMLHACGDRPCTINLILASVFSGFTLCIKHSGLLTFVFVLIYIIALGIKRSLSGVRIIVTILVFTVITLLLPIGWYIKSYIYTGNPVYPFFYHAFGGALSSAPDIMYWANPKAAVGIIPTLIYPIRATFDVSMVQLPFRLLPPTLIAVIPFLFFRFRRSAFSFMTLLYVIYFIILISILEPGEPRYNLAAWVLLGLLGVDAALRFEVRPRWFTRIIIPALLLLPLAFGAFGISKRYLNYRHTFIWQGQSNAEYYLGNDNYQPLDCYPIINWLNENATEEDGTVLLAEPRVFILNDDVNHIIAYPFQTEDIWDWDKIGILDFPRTLNEYNIKYIAITYGPNYRGICEGWFINQGKTELNMRDHSAFYDIHSFGMGNEYFVRLAGYANLHLTYKKSAVGYGVLEYDGRFQNIKELFESKGNVDVKLAASIMWAAKRNHIHRVFTDPAGAIFEVVE